MQINVSARFKRSYKKIPKNIQEDFKKKVSVFIKDPYHPSLKTHKLKEKFQECFSFYLKDGYRVLFEFSLIEENAVNLLDIGPHDIYKKR